MIIGKLLCPYCFARFFPWELCFRCVNVQRCGVVEDLALTEYRYGTVPAAGENHAAHPIIKAGRVFRPDWRARWALGAPLGAECPNCQQESTRLVCPSCHNDLPHQFGQLASHPIAMIGARGSGKSNYIGVVIQEFKKRLSLLFKGTLESLDEQTRRRYRESYELPLFHDHQVVAATVSAATVIENRYPLSYRLHLDKPTWAGTRQKVIGLTFFDTAGEDLLSMDTMHIHTRYIAYSRGLIILLDPLQMPAVRRLIPERTAHLPLDPHQDQVVERATHLIQNTIGIQPGQKIPIPVAIAFSKVDMLQGAVDPLLLRSGSHPGYVNLSDLGHVHEMWCSYLEEWGYADLLAYLDRMYRHWHLFGISALGSTPEGAHLPQGVNAFRVEDPLLWLLHVNGVVAGRR
jgi:hypothetical protein